MKLTTRCGSAVQGLNEALLAKAAEAKVLRTNRVRADTTVVPANVSYPTDSGLLARAIRRITVSGRRIRAAGGAMRTKLRDRSRAAGKRAHGIYRTFEQDVLVIDTKSLLGAYESNVRLSPINSGATLYPNTPARGSNTFTTIQNYPYTDRRRTRTVVEAVTELAVIDGVHDIRDHAIHVERRRGREIIKRISSRRRCAPTDSGVASGRDRRGPQPRPCDFNALWPQLGYGDRQRQLPIGTLR